MKEGQINLYFFISTALFISISIYLIYFVFGLYPQYSQSMKEDIYYSKAYVISELLIKDSGSPINWDSGNFNRVGLAKEPYLLDLGKIEELGEICSSSVSDIIKMKQSLGLDYENLVIEINYLNGTESFLCAPAGKKIGSQAEIKRIVTVDGQNNIAEVVIYVG